MAQIILTHSVIDKRHVSFVLSVTGGRWALPGMVLGVWGHAKMYPSSSESEKSHAEERLNHCTPRGQRRSPPPASVAAVHHPSHTPDGLNPALERRGGRGVNQIHAAAVEGWSGRRRAHRAVLAGRDILILERRKEPARQPAALNTGGGAICGCEVAGLAPGSRVKEG